MKVWQSIVSLVALFGVASPVSAQTFMDIRDAIPGRGINAATSTQAGATLTLGFETGFDHKTWHYRGMTASTAALYTPSIVESVTFTVVAPTGKTLARLHYVQYGASFLARVGRVAGETLLLVNGTYAGGASYAAPTLKLDVDLRGQRQTEVEVTIFVALHAFAAPGLTSTITVGEAHMTAMFE
jgi:hypothetical protein